MWNPTPRLKYGRGLVGLRSAASVRSCIPKSRLLFNSFKLPRIIIARVLFASIFKAFTKCTSFLINKKTKTIIGKKRVLKEIHFQYHQQQQQQPYLIIRLLDANYHNSYVDILAQTKEKIELKQK